MPAVHYEIQRGVARVTIDRPERKNAMDLAVFDELATAADRANGDPDVGAVIVTGRDGIFSSGIDVGIFGTQLDTPIDTDFIARLQRSFTAFEELTKPTLAVVEGYCFGAGIQLAVACHLRAVAPSAHLSVMEARWGLVPDLGGTWRLPRLVGLGRATELTLTARRVAAEEAVAIGLAEIALGADAQSEAQEYAERLASGPGAVRRAPGLLRDNVNRDREAALRAEAQTQIDCMRGHDFGEAVAAQLERRPPKFRGD